MYFKDVERILPHGDQTWSGLQGWIDVAAMAYKLPENKWVLVAIDEENEQVRVVGRLDKNSIYKFNSVKGLDLVAPLVGPVEDSVDATAHLGVAYALGLFKKIKAGDLVGCDGVLSEEEARYYRIKEGDLKEEN